MDKLAVELLTLISFYACTDGGPTGCSLSLVSRRIREVSRPARFFSVSLMTSPTQIEQFLECLQNERARATDMLPRVRHLCLSLFGNGTATTTSTLPASPSPSMPAPVGPPRSRVEFLAAQRRRAQQWHTGQDTLDEQYGRIIPALIRAVAPDVHTFAFLQAQWRSTSVIRCVFPNLRELTLVGGDPSFQPFAFVSSDKPLYPALKRLHHILAWVGKDVDFMQWGLHAPNVTHLRVSRLDYHPRITVETLDQAIGENEPECFPHLQSVVIQPCPAPPPVARMGPTHLAFRDYLVYLERLAERARVPVRVLPPLEMPKLMPGVDPQQKCIHRVKDEWLDRVEGDGDGCWREGMHGRQAPIA
ncbi:uncharacterized protein TRAVEDRAFT_75540 [Trametes versicolor FP-101664 SS1]|uniref:F-box domain-containing protein n=1 Tax=Trametes versicolor (strain FP-101664) TaxID=717944 RepID=R7S731_TRAVS|nr:uncharacterized protein TRAVEDRAFT_75540 [Trametes versicolor FP-101664 SS1]EIW51741.1 hypothetical protein TRAVEDRAFT_75540 [Trametes versicolor FP-101664 SS1]